MTDGIYEINLRDLTLEVGSKIYMPEHGDYGVIIDRYPHSQAGREGAHPFEYRTDCNGMAERHELELVNANIEYRKEEKLYILQSQLDFANHKIKMEQELAEHFKKKHELEKARLEISIDTLERNVTDVRKLYDDLKLELEAKALKLSEKKLEELAEELGEANDKVDTLKAELSDEETERENFETTVGDVEGYIESIDKDLNMFLRPAEYTVQGIINELKYITSKV